MARHGHPTRLAHTPRVHTHISPIGREMPAITSAATDLLPASINFRRCSLNYSNPSPSWNKLPNRLKSSQDAGAKWATANSSWCLCLSLLRLTSASSSHVMSRPSHVTRVAVWFISSQKLRCVSHTRWPRRRVTTITATGHTIAPCVILSKALIQRSAG